MLSFCFILNYAPFLPALLPLGSLRFPFIRFVVSKSSQAAPGWRLRAAGSERAPNEGQDCCRCRIHRTYMCVSTCMLIFRIIVLIWVITLKRCDTILLLCLVSTFGKRHTQPSLFHSCMSLCSEQLFGAELAEWSNHFSAKTCKRN